MIFFGQTAFQELQAEDLRSQAEAESLDSTGSTRPPPRTEASLLIEAGGGPYKGKAYGIGPLLSKPRFTYAPSTSTSVSQE